MKFVIEPKDTYIMKEEITIAVGDVIKIVSHPGCDIAIGRVSNVKPGNIVLDTSEKYQNSERAVTLSSVWSIEKLKPE